ncbi:MAG TPA: carbonic anhydrase family protein [Methanosarcinaceae archaeon]|nr:carbonic anhydrase family protein [Methanosarcinaceae archaeon]
MILSILITGAVLISGCTGELNVNDTENTGASDENAHAEEATEENANAEEATEEHHWGYEGEGGPEHWAELGYPDASGSEQSPIDIPDGTSLHDADIIFNYDSSALNIINNGHTIKVDYDEGSTIEVENNTYKLLQYHFHYLSEHTIRGEHSDMELHLVHQSDDGKYAVIGVMMDAGTEENSAYTPIWDYLPAEEGEVETIDGITVNAVDLLPEVRTYYRYDGSFTTPPCTEGINWFMMDNPVELSTTQIDAFKEIYSNNYRPVQPLNDREFIVSI